MPSVTFHIKLPYGMIKSIIEKKSPKNVNNNNKKKKPSESSMG